MTIFNLGSINIDYIYRLPHLVRAGETLGATHFEAGLGGKGANQSIAIARGGGRVRHGGMLHRHDEAWLAPMVEAGVDVGAVILGDVPSGHAIVAVDAAGENQIILAPLSNGALPDAMIAPFLTDAAAGDWALAQNETNLTADFLTKAKTRGMQICYSAAPFVAEVVAELLPLVDLLIINAIEAEALTRAIGKPPENLAIPHLIITRGGAGADYFGKDGTRLHTPAIPAEVVDTTGAGDTYLGYVLAGLDNGAEIAEAMRLAAAAASIQVSRLGASAAIPTLNEVRELI